MGEGEDVKTEPPKADEKDKGGKVQDEAFDLFAEVPSDGGGADRWERILYRRVFSQAGKEALTKRQMNLMIHLLERENRWFWKGGKWKAMIIDSKNVAELDRVMKLAMINRLGSVAKKIFAKHTTASSRMASLKERNILGLTHHNFYYTEVGFSCMAEIFWGIIPRMPRNGVFYELGSGSGRPLVAAALLHQFEKCVGIEILQDLVHISRQVIGHFVPENRDKEISKYVNENTVRVINTDFKEIKWAEEADVVFVNCSSFDDKLRKYIGSTAEKMKPGSYVITTTFPLEASGFIHISARQFDTEAGYVSLHVHHKPEDDANRSPEASPKTSSIFLADLSSRNEKKLGIEDGGKD